VLKEFKNNKSPGSDGINLELFRYAYNTLKSRFTELLCRIWYGETPPECWQKALFIPIYKTVNHKDCENYRGISLKMPATRYLQKLLKKLKNRCQDIIVEEQNEFRKGRLCADGYFSLNLLREKHKEFYKETHLAFIDYTIAFDGVDRSKLLEIVADDGTLNQIVTAIWNVYRNNVIAIKLKSKESYWKQIKCRVRQEYPLSPLLFSIYINAIIRHWRRTTLLHATEK
jgi:hypothetical protein